MEYQNVRPAVFLERPNRFIARCLVEGEEVVAHVKNTGRCRELLIPGVTVHLEYAPSPTRRTAYSLIAVEKGERLINMDSQAPNPVFREGLERGVITLPGLASPITVIHPEVRAGASRLDFLVEAGEAWAFVEVKGVTLEEDGVVLFPDAPTQRGVKHLWELAQLMSPAGEPLTAQAVQVAEGLAAKKRLVQHPTQVRSYVALIVQMEGVRYFTPNSRTHPAFGEALATVAEAGVGVLCYDCHTTPHSITAREPVPVRISPPKKPAS